MPIIKSKGGLKETTLSALPGGTVTMRQNNCFMQFDVTEQEQLLDYLEKTKNKRETGLFTSNEEPVVHPGEFLRAELEHRKLSLGAFAAMSGCTLWEVQALIRGEVNVTPLMAHRLSCLKGKDMLIDGALGWLYLQAKYDLAQLEIHNKEVASA